MLSNKKILIVPYQRRVPQSQGNREAQMTNMESSAENDSEAIASQSNNVHVENNALPTRLIPGFETFDDYNQGTYDAIRAGIKAANNMPIGENFNYYNCFPSFNAARKKDMKRITDIMHIIMNIAGVTGNIENRDVEEKFEFLQETNDLLLDQANIWMDEECGILQKPEVQLIVSQKHVNSSWNARTDHTNKNSDEPQSVRLLGGKNVQRPQLMFKDKIDNSSQPWKPRITEKPNCLKPLDLYIEESENSPVYNHPYEFELNKFETPECQLTKKTPMKYKSLDDTQLIYIDDVSEIESLLKDLNKYNEISVDLEHHSYRSFQGITCLMQISTGDTDYLIDTLTLRSDLHQLNEIFTKPSILKVFHGADADIQWLQKDLSLYVVNMFDTHQAAKQLKLPYLSLAYLLKKYCDIDPNKHFQLADWRIRPLPEELLKYAREDTHYLLYIKDILINELIELANGQNNILKSVYDTCTDLCKRTYVKPIWTDESCMSMYRKSQKMFNNKQMYAYKELHAWRDHTARQEDDSIGYVLPNHMLFNIAETLPREMQGILACCNPIPPLVRRNLLTLHKIVWKAREQSLVKTIPEEDFRQRLTQRNQVVNSNAWIYQPHDIPNSTEERAHLPCLLDRNDPQCVWNADATLKHAVSIFDTSSESEHEETVVKKQIFISPFKRYKCVIPMIAEEEAKEREKQQKEEEKNHLNEPTMVKDDVTNAIEIMESKNRVYEHFKQVSQSRHSEEVQSSSNYNNKKKKKKKKKSNIFLSQMPNRKRKQESNIKSNFPSKSDNQGNSNQNFTTPTPSLDVRIRHISKKTKLEAQNAFDQQKTQQIAAQIQDNKNLNVIKSIRNRKKGDKKANRKLLKEQGMLPSEQFDYKTVDFSSFQGGSTGSNANQAQFQQSKKKKKDRYWNRKKPKLNI